MWENSLGIQGKKALSRTDPLGPLFFGFTSGACYYRVKPLISTWGQGILRLFVGHFFHKI